MAINFDDSTIDPSLLPVSFANGTSSSSPPPSHIVYGSATNASSHFYPVPLSTGPLSSPSPYNSLSHLPSPPSSVTHHDNRIGILEATLRNVIGQLKDSRSSVPRFQPPNPHSYFPSKPNDLPPHVTWYEPEKINPSTYLHLLDGQGSKEEHGDLKNAVSVAKSLFRKELDLTKVTTLEDLQAHHSYLYATALALVEGRKYNENAEEAPFLLGSIGLCDRRWKGRAVLKYVLHEVNPRRGIKSKKAKCEPEEDDDFGSSAKKIRLDSTPSASSSSSTSNELVAQPDSDSIVEPPLQTTRVDKPSKDSQSTKSPVTEAEAPQFLQDPPYVRADFFGADFDALATAPTVKGELLKTYPGKKDQIDALFDATQRIEFETPCFYQPGGETRKYTSFLAWIANHDVRGKDVVEFLAALLDLFVAGSRQHQLLQSYIAEPNHEGDLFFVLKDLEDRDDIVLGNSSDPEGPTPLLYRKVPDFIEELTGVVEALAAQNPTSAVLDLSTPQPFIADASASAAEGKNKGKGKGRKETEVLTLSLARRLAAVKGGFKSYEPMEIYEFLSLLRAVDSNSANGLRLNEIDTPGQLDGWDKKEYSKKAKVKEQLVKTLKSVLDDSEGTIVVSNQTE